MLPWGVLFDFCEARRMTDAIAITPVSAFSGPTREQLLHALYEAAELEHNLMCTYLYAAFSLKDGEDEGLSAAEADAVKRWRTAIVNVAIDEMGHLSAVWNITAALGGAPRFGRTNFPLDPGFLPAGVVVKLAPFCEAVLQHFIHLERHHGSPEPDGAGYEQAPYTRVVHHPRLTPMGRDYDTVGEFYERLEADLRAFVQRHGDQETFCGDPALQLSPLEVDLLGARPVQCLNTALEALNAIIEQGEGAPADVSGSHFQTFLAVRAEYQALKAANPAFEPAHPAAINPVLRPPPQREGHVWLEDEQAAETVDLANTGYAVMLRLLAYAFAIPRPSPEKALAIDLAIGLMAAVAKAGERAARLPAGPSNPDCNAGMSFIALRDAAAFPPGPAARRFFVERIGELAEAAAALAAAGDRRMTDAMRILEDLRARAERGFAAAATASAHAPAAVVAAQPPVGNEATSMLADGVEVIEGTDLDILYEGHKCIHSRFCVTLAPKVFLANVKGPWIHPDAMATDALVEVAHACVSGAIRYRRKDGHPDEPPPPVNLLSIREAGPYAFRGDIRLGGAPIGYRATLCRCGASKHKPYCDGSHHDVEFTASGEPPTGAADALEARDGPLLVDPQTDGPLQVRGNLEIISGTGRVVARVQKARLCRCGASKTKPFCDNSHVAVGFRSS
jgi:CDGSH-type Zn-finger protein/uncharacterized Fe-S cluster protein YjdI